MYKIESVKSLFWQLLVAIIQSQITNKLLHNSLPITILPLTLIHQVIGEIKVFQCFQFPFDLELDQFDLAFQ